ncbi:MAG: methylmalonyl Co-A mutase-associated GTPase MeaB [Nitrososphaerales archaeon]
MNGIEIVNKVLSGDNRAIAKLISNIENQAPNIDEVLMKLYPHTGNAYVIGVTGATGVGKSTLINGLINHYKSQGLRLGVICIDPSSPITGGAILGDRLRLVNSIDERVFIRSMATRGYKGGITKSLRDVIRVLDASGKELIIIETIGVSQVDVEIANYVDTLLLVVMPYMGDEIQLMKAGLLEVADIVVINKADLTNSEDMVLAIKENLNSNNGWEVPVIKTVAINGFGIPELINKINEHKNYLLTTNGIEKKRKDRIKEEILEEIFNIVKQNIVGDEKFDEIVKKVFEKEITPHFAAQLLIKKHKFLIFNNYVDV